MPKCERAKPDTKEEYLNENYKGEKVTRQVSIKLVVKGWEKIELRFDNIMLLGAGS